MGKPSCLRPNERRLPPVLRRLIRTKHRHNPQLSSTSQNGRTNRITGRCPHFLNCRCQLGIWKFEIDERDREKVAFTIIIMACINFSDAIWSGKQAYNLSKGDRRHTIVRKMATDTRVLGRNWRFLENRPQISNPTWWVRTLLQNAGVKLQLKKGLSSKRQATTWVMSCDPESGTLRKKTNVIHKLQDTTTQRKGDPSRGSATSSDGLYKTPCDSRHR